MSETNEKTETGTKDRIGYNVTSVILGVLSIALFTIWNGCISLPSGIMAIIFGFAGRKEKEKEMGIAGMICGIIGLVLCIVTLVLNVVYGVNLLGHPIG